ncbi:MAG: transglycosylase domain-containing protein [Deltaproteobacteria bacterium]|nr:transglycosylase domain-containing protein [Deltaproteobacteria bacterium]
MRKAVRVGLPALGLAVLCLAGLSTVGAERYVSSRIVPELEARLGARIDVAGIGAVPGSVTLYGVRLTPRGASGPAFTASRIVARYSVVGLLAGRKVDFLAAEDARILVSRSDAGGVGPLAAMLRRNLERGGGRSGGRSATSTLPEIRLTDGRISVHDHRGLHVEALAEASVSRGGAVRLVASSMRVRGTGAEALTIGEVVASFDLRPRTGTRLDSIRLSAAEPRLIVREVGQELELSRLARLGRELAAEILGDARIDSAERQTAGGAIRVQLHQGSVEAGRGSEHLALQDIHGWIAPDTRRDTLALSLRGLVDDGSPWELEAEIDLGASSGLGRFQIEDLPLEAVRVHLPALPLDAGEGTRLGANVQLRYDGASGRLGLDGRVTADRMAVVSSSIASEPLRDLGLEVSGKGAIWLRTMEVAVSDARVSLNGVPFLVHGDLDRSGGLPRITLDITLPPTPCGTLLRSMPSALVANLGGMTLDGVFGADLHLALDMARPRQTDVRFDVGNACRLVSEGALASIERLRGPFMQHASSAGEPVEFLTGPGSPSWTPYEEISPHLIGAVLTTEDGGFFGHHGFSAESIRQAIIRDLREGRFVVGGSTISMQLVKNVFLTNEKTLARKLQEAVLTWMLEQSMGKEEILELYLNVIEYGPSLYGIRNAAEHFFGVQPADLTPIQAVYIATVLPDPVRRYGTFLRGSVSEAQLERLHRILRLMNARGRLEGPLDEALSQPLVFRGAGSVAERRSLTDGDSALQ